MCHVTGGGGGGEHNAPGKGGGKDHFCSIDFCLLTGAVRVYPAVVGQMAV